MSNEEEKATGLVPSPSSALSRVGTTSLAQRGMQDLIARAEAEQWCEQGRIFQRQEQYGEAVECFRRGLQFDPNHEYLQFLMGSAYYQGNGVPERDYAQASILAIARPPSRVMPHPRLF